MRRRGLRLRLRARRRALSRRVLPPWRRWFPAIAALALLLLAPALTHAQGAGTDSLTLRWTAVGDDSLVGTAAEYDLRMSPSPITLGNWDAATAVTGLAAPRPSGSAEQVVVRGLTSGTTYYFAIRTRDDAGNWSGVSNVVRWDGFDTTPPPPPTGLAADVGGGGVTLTWTASTAPDLAGYSLYRATGGSGPWTKLNLDLITQTTWQDDALPPGAHTLWYQVSATNVAGNEGARSAAVSAVLVAETPALAWRVAPPYPNPSHLADPVRIPVELSTSGSARLDIVDAAGHLVRRIDLQGLAPGQQEVEWDGRNDAGRTVAPGPYRAWLVAGGQRVGTRLVRVP